MQSLAASCEKEQDLITAQRNIQNPSRSPTSKPDEVCAAALSIYSLVVFYSQKPREAFSHHFSFTGEMK